MNRTNIVYVVLSALIMAAPTGWAHWEGGAGNSHEGLSDGSAPHHVFLGPAGAEVYGLPALLCFSEDALLEVDDDNQLALLEDALFGALLNEEEPSDVLVAAGNVDPDAWNVELVGWEPQVNDLDLNDDFGCGADDAELVDYSLVESCEDDEVTDAPNLGDCDDSDRGDPVPHNPEGVGLVSGQDADFVLAHNDLSDFDGNPLEGDGEPGGLTVDLHEDDSSGSQDDGRGRGGQACVDFGDNDFEVAYGGAFLTYDVDADPLLDEPELFGCGNPLDFSGVNDLGAVQLGMFHSVPLVAFAYVVCFDQDQDGSCVTNDQSYDAWDSCGWDGVSGDEPPSAWYRGVEDGVAVFYLGSSLGDSNPGGDACWPRGASYSVDCLVLDDDGSDCAVQDFPDQPASAGPGNSRRAAPDFGGDFEQLVVFVNAAVAPDGDCGLNEEDCPAPPSSNAASLPVGVLVVSVES